MIGTFLLAAVLTVSDEGLTAAEGVSRTERTDKVRVACIGDSITWGYAMTNRVAECYPAQLQRLLGPGYDVRNFGDPGAGVYSQPKANPSGWTEHTWRSGANGAAAYAFEPDIVVSNLGINDSGSYLYEFTYDEKGRPKTEPGLFRREYEELLRAFGKGGKLPRIIMWTRLGPIGKSHPAKGSPNPFVMERDLRAVAEAVGAEQLDMYTPLLPYAETPDFAADGVHPEGGAQRVIAEITAKRILRKFCDITPAND
ncbi:MAG: GDSL-type esterase/lipase family protein [Kiritimatiellae bacterium]|nr:GDSL-type esterase/lipase family protein [Kiritimatiellia bacterium]